MRFYNIQLNSLIPKLQLFPGFILVKHKLDFLVYLNDSWIRTQMYVCIYSADKY